MTKIEIRCPACGKIGSIDVPLETVKKREGGLIAINVGKKVCSHDFIVYLDKNLTIRDSFSVDFQIKLPEMNLEQINEKEIPESDVINVHLIKINIPALILTSIIRSCLFKQKILFLCDDFLHDHLSNFFNFLFKDTFEIALFLETPEGFEKKKSFYKDFIILNDKGIIRDKQKILNPKKIKFERSFVQIFFAETIPKSSMILLKNEILKIFEISKEIMDIIDNYEGKEKLGKKRLISMLKERKKIKISSSYLEFLLEIIKAYFNFDLSGLSGYFIPGLAL